MNVKELRTLVDNLDEYINVPGGIDRLKKMILHLAVSGQLVPQDPREGTGEELYQQIQAERVEIIKDGKLKKQKTLSEIELDEIPFKIPGSWKWSVLGNVITLQSGVDLTPSQYNDGMQGIPYITGASSIDNETIIVNRWTNTPKNVAKKGDLLITCKGTIGTMAFLEEDEVHIARQIMAVKFNYLIEPIYIKHIISTNVGKLKEAAQSIIPGITRGDMLTMPVPIPSLSEQKRIIAKVDIIFALVDDLAKKYAVEQAERTKLVASSLTRLAKGNGDLALTHLTEIIRTRADAKVLRQTILHLAVSGQLVAQDPNEGTGEELYQQIQIKKAELKKQKTLSEITDNEIPFKIPGSWKWARLLEIYSSITPVTRVKTTDILISGNLPVVDQGQSYIAGYVNEGAVNKVDKPVVVFGDHTREIKLIDFDFIVGADGVKILEPILMESDFFYTLIDVFRPQSRGYGRHFKMLNDQIVPVPPLAEQKRIIAKTTQLLDLVTELEKHMEK